MFDSLIGTIAIVALIVVVARQNGRIRRLEREFGALRASILANPPAVEQPKAAQADVGAEASVVETSTTDLLHTSQSVTAETSSEPGPWARAVAASASDASVTSEPVQAEPAMAAGSDTAPKSPDIETALGTRWAVWVGGLALALGGLFLVRYSIEAGIFGPGVRLAMAGLLGLVLVGGGEFVRRTGFKVPVEGAAGAYVPGILTAAGAFTLFGTVYAAHGIYGFIGPTFAFLLLGVIGVGSIAAALVHGQALAGLGLLGSMATPALVSSQSPNVWALFGYLAIVLVANTAIARMRDWKFLASAGFVGIGLWTIVYLGEAPIPDFIVLMFVSLVTLATLFFIWLRPMDGGASNTFDWPTIVPAFFLALTAALLLAGPEYQALGGIPYGAVLIFAMLVVAFYRPTGLPLLHAAGIATVLVHAQAALTGSFAFQFSGGEVLLEGFAASPYVSALRPAGIVLAIIFLVDGFWSAWRSAGSDQARAAAWAGWGTLVPLVVLVSLWVAFGDLDRDLGYAAAALVLTAVLVAGGEAIARREAPPLTGGLAVSFALLGAGVAAMLMLHMAFGPLWTTMLAGLLAVVPALATRMRTYPVLGWLSVGAVIVVLGRAAFDPTIVGAMLSRTPVFNALLPGYGVPALAFGFAAWQLARTTAGRPRLVMEAAAALFTLLTLAMIVRHAMNGGVINTNAPTLAEQAIYTLIAIGAGAILVALDLRSPSSVLRIGSLAAGVVSVALVASQHFIVLNPVVTDESTGKIPFFNLLFLAYLLPAIAAGALALYARGRRPKWYSAMLGLLASALLFVYATLSVRRLFQGEHIGYWAGMGQLETYAYSALWLAMGVALLVAGVWQKSQVLRIASAVLIAVAVAKVFIFDMSELEGVLRALSFIGLGAVLIGIGLFYQKLLTRAAGSTAAPAS
ncbi:DUF2339 domain-containing protein [Mesorhizobium sp. KR9-304]|uniref:DUF2339 domain-containing protein n=1 Tax=Mesorhizobium sp. KR9-304 TaxID=3156614 RepID=UPI0032B35312